MFQGLWLDNVAFIQGPIGFDWTVAVTEKPGLQKTAALSQTKKVL